MRVSLCLIARDEERFLAGCLESVRGVVDELVVVDTGSRDRTVEIAREHGARVLSFAWRDDFAAARNASLAAATGDLALVLDADERLVTDGAREGLERFASRHPGAVGRVRVEDVHSGGVSWVSRVVPLDGRHRFAGRVHEQVRVGGEEPLRLATELVVRHLGYAPDVVAERGKDERYARLLGRELADRPDDPYLAYQLGRAHLAGGRHGAAREALERALVTAPDDAPWAAHLVESLCYALRALGRTTEALRLVEPVAAAFAARSDTQFVAALLAMDEGHLERARRGYGRCLELAGTLPDGGPHDPSSATTAPAHNLGVMAEVLGRPDEARAWYERTLALDPDHGPARAGLERLAALERA